MPDSNNSVKKADNAKVSAEKLQQKILLSDEQTAKVKDILNDLLSKNLADGKNLTAAEDKINSLLDAKQKAKFDIIKNEWMNSFLKEVKKSPSK
jgi:hypothetical protein